MLKVKFSVETGTSKIRIAEMPRQFTDTWGRLRTIHGDSVPEGVNMYMNLYSQSRVRSGQVWEHVPRRHFAALTFLLHSLGLFRATARACARPTDHSFI